MSVPVAITFYSVSVSFHIIFSLVGFGSAFAFPFMFASAGEDTQKLAWTLGVVNTVMTKLISPLAVLVLLTGLYQVSDSHYSFSDDQWLGVSFVLFVAYMGIVGAIITPSTRKAKKLAEAEAGSSAAPSPELAAELKKQNALGPVLGVLIFIIVFLMEAKPF